MVQIHFEEGLSSQSVNNNNINYVSTGIFYNKKYRVKKGSTIRYNKETRHHLNTSRKVINATSEN